MLVTDAGVAKLADFGCSKQLPGKQTKEEDIAQKIQYTEYILTTNLLFFSVLHRAVHSVPGRESASYQRVCTLDGT